MREPVQQLERESIILRIFWMLLFFGAWQLAEVLLGLVVLAQLGCRLLQGKPHPVLLEFGSSLTQYLAQIGRFGTFNSEEKPWPFADWPQPAPAADALQ